MTSKTASEAAVDAYVELQIALGSTAAYCTNPTAKEDESNDYRYLAAECRAVREKLESIGVKGIVTNPQPPEDLVEALIEAFDQVDRVQSRTMIETTPASQQARLAKLRRLAVIYGSKC